MPTLSICKPKATKMSKKIIGLFFVWRTLLFFIAFLAPQFIHFYGDFPFRQLLLDSHLPPYISSFANFDGANYLAINHYGYNLSLSAFFPLYPLLISLFSILHQSVLISLFISNISLVVVLLLINRLFKPSFWFYLIFLSFPTAFFLASSYTESLFLMLLLLSLLHPVFGFFTGATRIVGVFTSISLFLKKSKLFFTPILGLISYCLYSYFKFKDPLAFFHTVSNFGTQRAGKFILLPQVYYRYFKIFFTASFNFQYLIALLEFTVFTGFLIILFLDLKKSCHNINRLSLNLFSWCNLLLPTLTGSFSSIPRYALLSLSAFFYLSEIKSTPLKITLFSAFSILQILCTAFFIQGYFIG